MTMSVNEWLLLNLSDLLINKGETEGSGECVTHSALLCFALQVKNCLGYNVSTYIQTHSLQSFQAVDAPLLLPS